MADLGDRLRSRQLPRTIVHLRVDFSDEHEAALAALDSAQELLARAQHRGDVLLAEEAQARVDAARAVVDEGYAEIVIRAIPPAEYEELMLAHPPTDAQRGRDAAAQWNPDTLVPALLAACVESELTADDWAELVGKGGQLASGEKYALFNAAMQVNDRSPEVRLGKGSTPTRR